ncbi:DUF885 domain-containing protein [Edaphosphingomonas haloaromaticamans]|uniref:Tat pathway signal sequence domain protein n=1 Tax=Edaphosphingomonas haloaromaticamans TaxID=653954 RepID=A0A1S1HGD4_9SPHN|nr:DUF885 family protein [Sphingomonas haloaromaticamans]OHT20273.1 hypothetical protein BHE75_02269 [Sphingomonas haloaromaticamans]
MDRRSFLVSSGALALGAALPAPLFAKTDADGALNALLDSFFYESLEDSPEAATSQGLDKGPRAALKSKLSDYSTSGRAKRLVRAKDQAARLARVDRAALSSLGHVNYDVTEYMLAQDIKGLGKYPFGSVDGIWSPYAISQLGGAYQGVPDFLDSQHGIENKADADAYLARLDAFATVLDQDSERQRAEAAYGAVAPDFSLDLTIAQLEALRGKPAAETVLVQSIARRTKEKGIAGDWAAQAAKIVSGKIFPALDRQIALVKQLRATASSDAGVWRLPEGAAFYADALANSTTTTLSPEEIHQIGLEQVAELTARIDTILKAEGMMQGTVGERLTALNADPKQLYPNTDEGRAALLASLNADIHKMTALLPRAFSTLPKAPIEVRRVPVFIQDGAPNGYYNPAALDGSRDAIYYINLKDTHDWPKYGLPALTFHEAVPGHHLQGSLAQETQGIPILRRQTFFSAYGEGWALYAEGVAEELGAYGDDRLGIAGSLQSLLFRAVRLVIDTGIHAKRWTREQATDYMVANTGFPRPRSLREVERYCVWPGQACSYKVGHNKWVELRKRAEAELGDRFDLAWFHDVLLDGAMPLTILEARVNERIAARKA